MTKRERLKRLALKRREDEACNRCGEDDPACLVFHHPDPSEKVDSVAGMISDGYAEHRLRSEMAKCVVLCANCHRRIHFEQPQVAETDSDEGNENA